MSECEDDDFDLEIEPECGLDANGQCSMPGSEYCDFECGALAGPWGRRRTTG